MKQCQIKKNPRRSFFQNIWSEQLSNHSSRLNPINTLNSQLAGILPPVEKEVLFLNCNSFGIRPVDYARIKSIDIENYLEEQLDYESIDNSELENLIDVVYPLVNASLTEIVKHIEEGNALGEDRATDAAIQLISATMFRQLYSKHQLFEVMVEFWSNHFNVDIGKQINGGQIFTQWPGLQEHQLNDGDLDVTTHFREVFSELLLKRLKYTGGLSDIIPDYAYNDGIGIGIFK